MERFFLRWNDKKWDDKKWRESSFVGMTRNGDSSFVGMTRNEGMT